MVIRFATPIVIMTNTGGYPTCRVCGRSIADGDRKVRWVIGAEYGYYYADNPNRNSSDASYNNRYMHAHFKCWVEAGGSEFIMAALDNLSDEELKGMGLEVEQSPEDWWRSLNKGDRVRVTDVKTHPGAYHMGPFAVGQELVVERVRTTNLNGADILIHRSSGRTWWVEQDSVERVT